MFVLDALILLVILFVTVAGAILWHSFSRSAEPSAYQFKRHLTPFGLIDVLIMAGGWILFPGLVAMVPMAIWGFPSLESLSDTQMNLLIILTSISQLTFCLAGCGYLVARYGTPERVFGVALATVPHHVWLALRAFCMVVPLVLVIQVLLSALVPYHHDTIEQLLEHFSLVTMLATWLAAVFVAPICEEIVFRGVLQGWLQRIRFGGAADNGFAELVGGWPKKRGFDGQEPDAVSAEFAGVEDRTQEFRLEPENEPAANRSADDSNGVLATDANPYESPADPFPAETNPLRTTSLLSWWLPIVASSAVFAAVHIGQGLAPVSLFFFALALGFLYRYTGSILPSIILHGMLNAFSMFQVTLHAVMLPAKEML